MDKHKRSSDLNQQVAKSTRPQLPRDGSKDGVNSHKSGQLQPGGFTAVWNFNGNTNTKDSSTTKPGNAGGGKVC